MDLWNEWEDIIEELDAGSFTVTDREAEFLESLLDRKPLTLSARQVEWLQDMCRKYGVMHS